MWIKPQNGKSLINLDHLSAIFIDSVGTTIIAKGPAPDYQKYVLGTYYEVYADAMLNYISKVIDSEDYMIEMPTNNLAPVIAKSWGIDIPEFADKTDPKM